MEKPEKVLIAAAVLKNTYDLNHLASVDEDAALGDVISDIEDLLALNDLETRKRRHSYFNVTGTNEDSYCEELFELDSSRLFLAGIRHVGGDPNKPFVCVTPGFELKSEDIPAISTVLRDRFSVFHPSHFSVWMKSSDEPNLPKELFTPANRYLARKTADLDLSVNETLPFEIRPIEDNEYFPWYQREYLKFYESNPKLKSWVSMSDKEDLEDYRSHGLLWGAYLRKEIIGLVGGESQNLLGSTGLYICELLIAEKHKRKGYAAQMQKEFIRRTKENFEVVWGTIDARNKPSTKTALRVGRKAIRTECFIPLG